MRAPREPSRPQEYERLAASLDGAQKPLLEKMQAFFPVSSKVDLVEAAEAHAWRLDQLAHNLSRCEGRGPGDAAQGPAGQSGPRGAHGFGTS